MKKYNTIEKIEDEIARLEYKLDLKSKGNIPSERIHYRQELKEEIIKKKKERESLIKSLLSEYKK